MNLIETALDLEDCKTTIEAVVIYVDYLDSHLSIDGLQWDLDDKRVNITRLSLDREGHKHREYTINLPRAESRFEDNRLVEIRLDSPKRTTGVHMRIVDVKAAQTLGCGPGLSRALDCGSWIRFELRLSDWDALDFQNHRKGSKFRADGELAVYIAGMFIAKGRFRIPYSDEKRRDFVYWYKDLVAAYDARSVTFSPRPMAFKIEDALLGIRRSECFSALNRVAGMYGRDVALELLDFVLGLPGGGNLTAGPFDWGEDDSKRYSDKFKDVNDLKQSIRDRARLFARCTQGQGE